MSEIEHVTDGLASGGLASIEELNGFQVIRKEFTTPVFEAKMTLNYDCLQFNAACVRLFSEIEYVQLLVSDKTKRLVAKPCGRFDKDAVKWSNIKDGKPQSRPIKAKVACAKLFKMMSWNITYRYKIMAVKQDFDVMSIIVFNLVEASMLEPVETEGKDGKRGVKRRTVYPIDWENTFGTPYAEHAATYEVNINTHHLLSNTPSDGETTRSGKTEPVTQGRVPVAAEILTRPYYTPDELIKGGEGNE